MVEESSEYRALIPRLAFPQPMDTWKADMRSSFRYELVPDNDGVTSNAVLVTGWEFDEPIAVVLVTPNPNGGEPQVVNLRESARSDADATAPHAQACKKDTHIEPKSSLKPGRHWFSGVALCLCAT